MAAAYIRSPSLAEKEWTHHGILLLPGLKQIEVWLDRKRENEERIAEGRIDEVKVCRAATYRACARLHGGRARGLATIFFYSVAQ